MIGGNPRPAYLHCPCKVHMSPLDDPRLGFRSVICFLNCDYLLTSGEMLSDRCPHALDAGIELSYRRSEEHTRRKIYIKSTPAAAKKLS